MRVRFPPPPSRKAQQSAAAASSSAPPAAAQGSRLASSGFGSARLRKPCLPRTEYRASVPSGRMGALKDLSCSSFSCKQHLDTPQPRCFSCSWHAKVSSPCCARLLMRQVLRKVGRRCWNRVRTLASHAPSISCLRAMARATVRQSRSLASDGAGTRSLPGHASVVARNTITTARRSAGKSTCSV